MLLTAPLLAKSSFFGSLINKCRQVINKNTTKPSTIRNEHIALVDCEYDSGKTNSTTTSSTAASPITTTTTTTSTTTNILPAVANLSLSSVQNVKTVEEKVGLPARPKKPLTPYFRYMQEMRPKLSAENPKASITDVVREISKRWPTVDASLKDRLQAEYVRDKQQYLEQRTKYDAKLTDSQRAEIKQMKQEISDAKERRMLRKRIKSLGRPKKPASAFLLFIAKERLDAPRSSKETYREWHKKSTEKWTRLSEQEKEVFMQAARKELEKYKKEITAWEDKMIRQGNIDVVRQSSLIEPAEPKPKKN